MKKIIYLIGFLVCMQYGFSKSYIYVACHNITQNTFWGYQTPPNTNLNVSCNFGDSVILSSYVSCDMFSANPYIWYFEGDTVPNSSGQMQISFVADQMGTYSPDLFFCTTPANIYFIINITTGISFIKEFNFLNIYPTTVNSSITIQLNSIKPNDVEIAFYDMNGKQLKTDFYKNISGEFIKNENTEALSKGIYFVRIKAGDEMVQKKFVKL